MKKQDPIPRAVQQVLKAARPAKDDPEGSYTGMPAIPGEDAPAGRGRSLSAQEKDRCETHRSFLFAFWIGAYFSTAAAKSRPY